MIDGFKAHWWSTKYNAKYQQPIKRMDTLTRDDLIRQFDEDFGINLASALHKEAAELIQSGKKNCKAFEEAISKIIDNRSTEMDQNKRISQEFYWRSRVLTLFPFAKSRYLGIKSAENAEALNNSVDKSSLSS